MIRFLVVLLVCWPSFVSAQQYWQCPPGYGYGLGYGTFYYPEPSYYERPRVYMTEAERWQRKLEALEAKEAYFKRRRQVELDKKEQSLINIQRSRDLDERASQMTPPVRSIMGEAWWKEHGHKVQ